MTPEEVELLLRAGQAFIFNISTVVTKSVLYGLYLAIFTFGVRALLKRNPWTRYTWTLFSFLSILCLIFTANLAAVVAANIALIRGCMVNNPEMSLLDRILLADDHAAGLNNADLWLGGSVGGGFLFVTADAVVVWRAWVLWPGNKMVKVSLLALVFTSFGSAVVSSTLETISFTEINLAAISSPIGVMLVLTQSLSLATNVVATTFIGYKAYYHRRMMRASMGMRNSKSDAILLFMTESGVAFCILQAIALATNMADTGDRSPLDYATAVWQQITIFAAVSYPVLVLIIVDSHRSISDSTGGSAADSGNAQCPNGIGSHISFAVAPRGTSSSGGRVGPDSMVESRADPTISVDHSLERSVRVRDLEKGERLTSGAALSD